MASVLHMYLVPKNKEDDFGCFPARKMPGLDVMSMATLNARTVGAKHAFDGAAHVMHFMETLLFDGPTPAVGQEMRYLLGQAPAAALATAALPYCVRNMCSVAVAALGADPRVIHEVLCGQDRAACVRGLTGVLALLLTDAQVEATVDEGGGLQPWAPATGVQRITERAVLLRHVRALEMHYRVCYGSRVSSSSSSHPFAQRGMGLGARAKDDKKRRADAAQARLRSTIRTPEWRQEVPPTSKLWPSVECAVQKDWAAGCLLTFKSVTRGDAWDAAGDPASLVRLVAVVCLARLAEGRGAGIWESIADGTTRLAWLACHANHTQLRALFIKGRLGASMGMNDSRYYCQRYIWHPLMVQAVTVWSVEPVGHAEQPFDLV